MQAELCSAGRICQSSGSNDVVTCTGTAALTTLLRGATPTRMKLLNSRIYVKPGNVDTALKDFHSLKSIKSASDVKEFEYEKVTETYWIRLFISLL